ncbi:MAG: thioredoxin [Lactobacillus sp.]|nr:thioredoxin [Lactobacillus sp.]
MTVGKKDFTTQISDGLVLVDFYADWCGPCKLLEPVLEKLTQEFSGKIKFVKVDVQQDQALAKEYNVMSIPTMLLFVDGVAKEKITGYRKLADMRTYLTKKLTDYGD